MGGPFFILIDAPAPRKHTLGGTTQEPVMFPISKVRDFSAEMISLESRLWN